MLLHSAELMFCSVTELCCYSITKVSVFLICEESYCVIVLLSGYVTV
jgi:hypothetical protein